jgi:hypothetical protein
VNINIFLSDLRGQYFPEIHWAPVREIREDFCKLVHSKVARFF